MGYSSLKFLEEYAFGQLANDYRIAYDEYCRLIDYAENNFREFFLDALDDYLDRELARVFHSAFGRVRFDLEVYPMGHIALNDDYSFCGVIDHFPGESRDQFIRLFQIRVGSSHFRTVAVEHVVPSRSIFESPSQILNWIYRIGETILFHVGDALSRPQTNGQRLFYNYMSGKFVKSVNKTALELLMSHCTSDQKRDYKENNWFYAFGGTTGNKYRIRNARQINVDLMNGNTVKERYCTMADPETNYNIPTEDQLLAQKTLIELNEELFLQTAIKHPPPLYRGYYE